jgi:hypothetical protein
VDGEVEEGGEVEEAQVQDGVPESTRRARAMARFFSPRRKRRATS